jgi:hypothetical protein
VKAVKYDSGGAVEKGSGLGVVNLCGGKRVAEWMWHNIWRERRGGSQDLPPLVVNYILIPRS